MKILYAALRNDPREIDRSSSVDYGFYSTFLAGGHEVQIVGPFPAQPVRLERLIKRVHDRLTGRRYLKWAVTSIWRASHAVNRAAAAWAPDVVFTMFPATVTFYEGRAPVVFDTDLTFQAWQAHGAGFSRPALAALNWIEKRALAKSQQVILHSDWSRRDIIARHGIAEAKLHILPMPAAIPPEIIPASIDVRQEKALTSPLRLLLVGKDYWRKGVDIATVVVAQLNERGLPAELTVCATAGPAAAYVRYVGPFRKSVPAELAAYAALYRQAHLLLHPARFEPAGIVPGEAAAFATPTITNDTGGLATTVQEGVSGLVLPKDSPAEAYVAAIEALIGEPERYFQLCQRARQRYEVELNWPAAGRPLNAILRAAAGLEEA